ncbi:MAG TPA: polysaccharide deacetylase family protein, partial [Pirellulales bacterium]|nr:polysaccharide deacetylase family protein [Pirellulales bacterium]
SNFVRDQRPFPHDVAAGHPLAPHTVAQLRDMAAAGIEIGAHTRTHSDLGSIRDPQTMRDEIVGGGEDLEDWLGQRVRYFAFPYGLHANLNRLAFCTAREVGYEAACSAYGAYNFPGGDGFHIQRAHGDPDMLRLRNWVSLDPRKLRMEPFVDTTPDEATRAALRELTLDRELEAAGAR